MQIQLKTIVGELIIEGDFSCIADAVNAAISAKKSLRSADLRSADLRSASLRYADLRSADLRSANLSSADLSSASLRYADLRSADLSSADLSSANLSYANLRSADLRSANLSYANLSSADLRYANLRYADLSSADLSSADLRYAKNYELAVAMTRILPAGTITGWKKLAGEVIAELEIPRDAKRSHAFGRKCRASAAKVIAMWKDNKPFREEAFSTYSSAFAYRIGETVTPVDKFDDDFTNECGSGIHFFITREEAEAYVP